MEKATKVVISSGHAKYVAGAGSYIDEVTEARKVVKRVAEYMEQLGATVHEFHDNTSKDKNTNLRTIVKYHDSKERQLDVSIHFNALKKTPSAMGTEVLYLSASGKEMAVKLSGAIAKAGGFKNRGAKLRENLYFLNQTNKPAVLIEVCFVDSKADTDLYKKNFDKICRAIAEGIVGKKLKAKTYKVVKGDTLWGISKTTGVSIANLKAYNGLKSDVLSIGQVLKLEK